MGNSQPPTINRIPTQSKDKSHTILCITPSYAGISQQEKESKLLWKTHLLELLANLKKEIDLKCLELNFSHRNERSEFLKKHVDWGSSYLELCKELREEYDRLVISQKARLKKFLKRITKEFLSNNEYDQELLEQSILHYANSSEVVKAVESLQADNSGYNRHLRIGKLLEICKFQSSLYKEVGKKVQHQIAGSRHIIVKVIISDLTYEKFNIEQEDIGWALKNMNVSEGDSIIEEFKGLKYLI